MVSDLNTFSHKGCKIAAQKKFVFSANFALLAGFFWYRCYYQHRSRDALSPVCGIFYGRKEGNNMTMFLINSFDWSGKVIPIFFEGTQDSERN